MIERDFGGLNSCSISKSIVPSNTTKITRESAVIIIENS